MPYVFTYLNAQVAHSIIRMKKIYIYIFRIQNADAFFTFILYTSTQLCKYASDVYICTYANKFNPFNQCLHMLVYLLAYIFLLIKSVF